MSSGKTWWVNLSTEGAAGLGLHGLSVVVVVAREKLERLLLLTAVCARELLDGRKRKRIFRY